MGDARAADYLRGLDAGRPGVESQTFADHPYNRAWPDAPDEGHCTECRLSYDRHPGYVTVPDGPRTYDIEPMTVTVIHGRPYPLTFEAMQQDCAARGCALVNIAGWHVEHLAATEDGDTVYADFLGDAGSPEDLASLDAWRQSLHGEG